jgi:uncharacterized protein YmfQ (DUF2313 family)
MPGNADVLNALFPVTNLGGVFADDIAVDGRSLDAAQAAAQGLLAEIFPDTAVLTLPSWERICGIAPAAGATLQARQAAVVAKLRARPGDIKKPYFVRLAASLGYAITITPYRAFMSGWGRVGDAVYFVVNRFRSGGSFAGDALSWVPAQTVLQNAWLVTVENTPIYSFRSGQSACGEPLTWWREPTELETILNNLRPADVLLVFGYDS